MVGNCSVGSKQQQMVSVLHRYHTALSYDDAINVTHYACPTIGQNVKNELTFPDLSCRFDLTNSTGDFNYEGRGI
jgi:hypothetical protein